MAEEQHDLSPYELLRLEKIRRNNARLKALGLGCGRTLISPTPKKKIDAKKRPRNKEESSVAIRKQPTRSSKRLRGEKADDNEIIDDADTTNNSNVINNKNDSEEESEAVDYKRLAKEPHELDDFEFQVYTNLRAWRLQRKNELEVEPYKICQNRTLCELIRRVRNDSTWGALALDGSGNKRSEDDIANDLIQCWGLGPSKVKADGFGPEMMVVVGEKKNVELLKASRNIGTGVEKEMI